MNARKITKSARALLTLLFLLSVAAPVIGYAKVLSAAQMTELLNSPDRSAADQARDEARKPAEVVAFAGIEPGMTVVDSMAAGGWYSEVLSLAVGADGKVYAQNPAFILEFNDGFNDRALAARLADDRLPNVERIDVAIADSDLKDGSVDLVFTALNFHDTYYMAGEAAAGAWLRKVREVLRPGGQLLLIDHNGGAEQDNAKLHRIPKDIVVEMATAAGFSLEAEGNMLQHPGDDGTQMVFMKSIRGKTDRFVLKLRKE